MKKPRFLEKRILNEIHKTFPEAKIVSYKKFKEGLVSPTYKVKINNPSRFLVIKIYKIKNTAKIKLNNKILNYLNHKGLPTPKVYSDTNFKKQGIVIMEFLEGKSAREVYSKSSSAIKRKILFNIGKLLRKIHNLSPPDFWIHYKHEVKNSQEWKNWTNLRIKKYLEFAKGHFDEKHYKIINDYLIPLQKLDNMKFTALHWDFHLSNMILNSKFEVSGLFDFDNAMKGDIFAELGQFEYWLRNQCNDYQNFKYFLKGYGLKDSEQKLKIINSYLVMHLVAVHRSIWKNRIRLRWLIKEHEKMLEELS